MKTIDEKERERERKKEGQRKTIRVDKVVPDVLIFKLRVDKVVP